VPVSVKSNENAKIQILVSTLKTKLKIVADSEAGKKEADIGHKHGILPKIARTTVADKIKI
jgi:hypothetical protein